MGDSDKPDLAAPAAGSVGAKTAVYEIGEDEAGMRLDRGSVAAIPTCRSRTSTRSSARARCGSTASAWKSRPGSKRPDGARRPAAAAVRTPGRGQAREPEDARAIRAMTLYEDRDVIVLNKPYGLAVQGGSGTKRHIDGMLEALAGKDGTRPVLVHRLDRDTSGVLLLAKSRKMAADLGEIFRSRQAKKIYWALVEGVPNRRGAHLDVLSPKGRGWARIADAGRKGRARRHRTHARRAPRRSRRATFGDPVRTWSTRSRRASRGCRCGRSPGAPISCAPIARRSATRSSATPNTTAGGQRPRPHRPAARRAAGPRAETAPARPPADPAASARRKRST